MMSYLFSGLGSYVAPRPDILHEFQLHMKSSNFDEALQLLKQSDHGININEIIYDEFYPLHLSCAAGELELTLELISQGADVCMPTPVTQNHPLHFASRNGHKSVVEILLRSGADPSIPNSHGLIPAELTNDKNISALLMRTNWISQRPKQYDESLEILLQNMTMSRTSPEKSSASSNDIPTLENETKTKKSITIAIPDTKSELNLPIQGYSKITSDKLPEKREKPNRRYSLPAGYPAIKLVDSPQKREYRVLNEKPSTRRVTPPSLGPLAEEEPPPPINSNHDLPLPFTVPHGVKKESPQSPVSKKNMATSHVSHAVARLKYPQASEGIGSPLNLPSKSRKGLQPKAYTHTSDNPPASDISTSLPENVSHRQKIRSSIANIWNQTQTEFSDDDAKEAKNSMTETYQSQLLFPNTMSPVISDSSTIPPRAQSGSLSASIARETRKLSTSSQRSRSESFIDCQEDPLTGFILPPPSASPSFPLSLSSSTPPTTDTLKEIDLFGREPKDYYVSLTPDSASQVEVAPIVPLDSARSILTSESSATEDDFEHDRKVNAAVQVTLDEYNETPLPNEMKSNSSFNQMRDEMNNILQSESSELLERMVLQAAVETAFSYQTVNTLGGKRKDVFKACHQIHKDLLEKLMAILNSEPELAVCRSCGVLSNFAPDGSTPLHCAARAGNIDVVKYLLSLKKPQSNENLVNVWARDLQGRVALHLAAEYEHVELCKVLMSAMTEPNEITRDPPSTPRSVVGSSAPVDLTGTTPLGWASRRRKGRPSSPIRELLFKEGDSSILPQKFYLERSGKTPRKRTQSKSHPSKNLSSDEIIFAHSEAQGWRPEMEDATLCQCPLLSNQSQTYWLFGVFDGHGGDFSSKFASSKLPSILVPFLHQLEYPLESDLKRILYDSCISLDAALSEEERMKVTAKQGTLDGLIRLNISDTSGTTACVLLITIDYLLLANIGDSRAVMARASSDDSPLAIPLSIDQKLSIEEERSRALRAGCTVQKVGDVEELYEVLPPLHSCKLRLSRSIGDFYMKWDVCDGPLPDIDCVDTIGSYQTPIIRVTCPADVPPKYVSLKSPPEQAVSCEPVILHQRRILDSDLFVIIACDGVWDVISNDEAVVLIYGQLIQTCQTYQAKSSLLTDDDIRSISAQACDKLLSECLQRQTNDNMTALLVLFPLMSSILKEMYQTSHTSIYSPAYCNSTSKLINSSETSPIGSTTPYDSRIFPTSDNYPYPAPSHSQNLRDRVSPEEEEDADDEDERADSPMKGKKLFS